MSIQRPLFRHLFRIAGTAAEDSQAGSETAQDVKLLFTEAKSVPEAVTVVAEGLRVRLAKMMGLPRDDIDLQHRVESYGVDSLVAVELRYWFAKERKADIAVFEILGGATLECRHDCRQEEYAQQSVVVQDELEFPI